MLSPTRFVTGLAAIFLATGAASADVVAITSGRDNTLYQDPTGSLSNGAGTGMFAGRNAAPINGVRRGLVWFDVAAAVPAGATITGATLRMHNSAANEGPAAVLLVRLLQDWGEGTSAAGGASGGGGGAPATAGDATWVHSFYPDTAWGAAGGVFVAGPSAVTNVAGPGSYEWSGVALAGDVQSFLDSPLQNFGWIIFGDESAASTAKRFATREEPLEGNRPTLIVEYVPAPSGAALLGLAGMSVVRRRRRSTRVAA